MPKQFISLLGERSCFQDTVLRVQGDCFFPPIIVTGTDYRFLVRQQLKDIGCDGAILLESVGRNSGPAILAAALHAMAHNPNAILLALAADHAIDDQDAFADAVLAPIPAALSGKIVIFGVAPDRPASGYGYIRPGDPVDDRVRLVEAFIEKPDESTARGYVEQGYLWNSGNFLFRADVILAEYESVQPESVAAVTAALDKADTDLGFLLLDAVSYAATPKASIDYAVMENTRQAAVIPVSYSWSDIGSWQALWEISERDETDSVTLGSVTLLDSSGAYVNSDPEVLTALIGMKDVIVVSTGDAVLVADCSRARDVGVLVEGLSTRNHHQATSHARVYRPWGWYQTLDQGDRFQVKCILVYRSGRLSLQRHFHRAEHWTVVLGTAEITMDGDHRILKENESTYIPLGAVHQLENPGHIALELIEVETGSYLGEDDIMRIDDACARQ
jgi:mannose-1-phosphate guanylyltransferase/mannose-6-phosphate isomerase